MIAPTVWASTARMASGAAASVSPSWSRNVRVPWNSSPWIETGAAAYPATPTTTSAIDPWAGSTTTLTRCGWYASMPALKPAGTRIAAARSPSPTRRSASSAESSRSTSRTVA